MSYTASLNPPIVCVNQAQTPLGIDFSALVAAMQHYLSQYVQPVWGLTATLSTAPQVVPGCRALVFLDNADTAGALGYHNLTPDGFPLSKVFVQTTLRAKELVSVTASHELIEMLCDPSGSLCAASPDGQTIYAYEVADAVEETSFPVDGIPLSNFVYPSWFEGFRRPGSAQFDQLQLCQRPFQLLKGGYMPVMRRGRWTQIFGSKAKERRFAKEDRRQHRTAWRGEPMRRSRKSVYQGGD